MRNSIAGLEIGKSCSSICLANVPKTLSCPVMVEIRPTNLTRHARQLRLDTLVRLRWLAIGGQAAAVTGVRFGLGFPLPFGLCFLVIAASVWVNLLLRIRFPASHRLSDNAATFLLAFDILQLAALLYLTGGLENPFAMLFLAP